LIINSDYNSLLIQKGSKLFIRNLNEYNILKHKDFDSNRINVTIGSVNIHETYNDGIFNITVTSENHNELKFQVHKTIDLCKHILFNDEKLLLKFLQGEKKTDINQQFLIKSLKGFYDNLKFTNDSIIINDLFKVDKNAQAYFLHEDKEKPLCIVAVNHEKFKMFDNIGLGDQEIDFKTMEILHKVLFLLIPNMQDSIFINQLPKPFLEKLKEIKRCL
jgi:hypothetical protein